MRTSKLLLTDIRIASNKPKPRVRPLVEANKFVPVTTFVVKRFEVAGVDGAGFVTLLVAVAWGKAIRAAAIAATTQKLRNDAGYLTGNDRTR
jgi:hypothetical protein